MSSKTETKPTTDAGASKSWTSPKTLLKGAGLALTLAAALYWIWLAQPPCASCHIEKSASLLPDGAPTCRVNGQIRPDWKGDLPLFARMDGGPLPDPADSDGYLAGECVDIPIACPPEGKTPILAFASEGKEPQVNAWCQEGCQHCEKK